MVLFYAIYDHGLCPHVALSVKSIRPDAPILPATLALLGPSQGSILPAMVDPIGVALPTLRRLPLYLRLLEERGRSGEAWLSSEAIAARLGLNAIQVRKDLSSAGAIGIPKRGFPVRGTAETLARILRAEDYAQVFVLGTGAIARALLEDGSVGRNGFQAVAVFHPSPEAVGTMVSGREVMPAGKLADLSRRMGVRLAALAVEPEWLAEAIRALADSDIEGLLDFTGLSLPPLPGLVVARWSFGASLSALAGELRKKAPIETPSL